MPTFPSAAGSLLHYELRGDGPLLVCHPGGPARPASYLDTLGGLDRTRTLLLLDSRGVGESEAADSYGFGSLAADLEELRLHLGVESLDVLGHSAGAWPVLAYAADHPHRIRRLVLLTPVPATDPGARRRAGPSRPGAAMVRRPALVRRCHDGP